MRPVRFQERGSLRFLPKLFDATLDEYSVSIDPFRRLRILAAIVEPSSRVRPEESRHRRCSCGWSGRRVDHAVGRDKDRAEHPGCSTVGATLSRKRQWLSGRSQRRFSLSWCGGIFQWSTSPSSIPNASDCAQLVGVRIFQVRSRLDRKADESLISDECPFGGEFEVGQLAPSAITIGKDFILDRKCLLMELVDVESLEVAMLN